MALSLPSTLTLSYNRLSSFSSSTADNLSLSLSSLSLHRTYNPQTTRPFTVRMGGGPRTFPGGVSKWQWKRMQKKKASQLLKARLMRERQIYEMRKRAELKAAVSELERPWEVVEHAAPNLFSVAADEQLKVLADRFQKPGGFDLWTEKDGPQLFETPDGLPTSRFFPKGVVHSIKPYARVNSDDGVGGIEDEIDGMGTHIGGRLTGGSNPDQESGQRLSGSMKQGRRGRNFTGRFSDAEDSGEKSSYSSNSSVSSGVNRRQRNLDREGSSSQRDRNLSVRFSDTANSHGESSYSSNSRVSSGVNRRQRNLDREGSGSQRDRNLSDTEDLHGESSYVSSSRGFRGVNRRQSDQRNSDKKGSGSQDNGGFRKIANRRYAGSGGGNGAIKVPALRRSSSSAREQRNSSREQIDGNNGSRRDLRLEKGKSSYQEDVFDLSLQTDGKYSLGSR